PLTGIIQRLPGLPGGTARTPSSSRGDNMRAIHRNRNAACVAVAAVSLLAPALTPVAGAQEAALSGLRPVPRLENGWVSFEAPPGERGVWNRGDYRSIVPENEAQTALRDRRDRDQSDPTGLKPLFSEVPFQPWAEALYLWRQDN